MPDPLAGLPPRFLRTPEAARFLSLSGRTLEKRRIYGTGPKYRKIGGRVVYALDDLQAWADLGGVGGEVCGELTVRRWDGPSPRLEVVEIGAVGSPRGGGNPGLDIRLDPCR